MFLQPRAFQLRVYRSTARSPDVNGTLARKLRFTDYFALAFGTMVGVGWLVVMDDWLGRGGPLGAILGFAIGGVLLLPVGYVYGQWVQRLPDAAGEAAYTAQVFPPSVSYFTGWIMLLAYFIVCPWEAVAVGKLAAYLFPSLNSFELYRIAGHPVFLPRLLLGLGLTVFITILNYRGVRASATFQNWSAGTVLVLFLVIVAASVVHGSPANFHPMFSATPFISILLTLQIVPYFMTGFESVPKVAEEAHPEFRSRGFSSAIYLAVIVGAGFYVLVTAAVSYVAPWQGLLGKPFATAVAFEQGTGAPWLVRIVMASAMVALFEVFNGNFVASSRLIFAFGRRGTIPTRFGEVHETFQTPSVAVVGIALASIVGLLLGDAILVPVTEVGSMAAATGWFMACLSFWLVEKNSGKRLITSLGIAVALLLVLMKLLPFFPGHFSMAEWLALAIWLAIGLILRRG
jgi:basic amino acid/polyamine antiporter, APA family